MRYTFRAGLLAASAALVLVGCDSLNDPNADEALNFDAAVVAADGALEDLQMMHGPRLGLRGAIFPGLTGGRPDCPKSQDVFLCDPIEREGITYTRSITYKDESGAVQDAFDESATESIEYMISVEGERSRTGWSASISRDRALVVTGLQTGGGQVVWNGSGNGSTQRSRHLEDGKERSYDMEGTSEIVDVVVPYPQADDGWPISGTITRTLTISKTVESEDPVTATRVVFIEFNGTNMVPVTVGDETFTLDLTVRNFGPRQMGGRKKGRMGGGR